MPYEVLAEELLVLENIGEILDKDGKHVAYEHRSVLYNKDEVVEDDKISPVTVALYDDGDEHTRSVLKRVPKTRAAKGKAVTEEEDSNE